MIQLDFNASKLMVLTSCYKIITNLKQEVQGIPAFRDFTIRDPRYFLILFQGKLAKKVDFR